MHQFQIFRNSHLCASLKLNALKHFARGLFRVCLTNYQERRSFPWPQKYILSAVIQNPDHFQRGMAVQGRGVATVEGVANNMFLLKKQPPGAKKLTFDLSIWLSEWVWWRQCRGALDAASCRRSRNLGDWSRRPRECFDPRLSERC